MTSGYDAIVIGASLGGISALKSIFSELPADFPTPIMVVQHQLAKSQLADSDDYLISFLDDNSRLKVKYALPGEPVKPGFIYFAPPAYHLLAEENHSLSLSVDLPVNYSIPSIDVLFESAVDTYQQRLIGVLLTGASSDGAKGLKKIKDAGGLCIVQDPASAECAIMPSAAIAVCPIDHLCLIGEIAGLLRNYCYD